jgi:hypothetical protein
MSAAPRDATAFEVREALPEAGCVVCRLSGRSVQRFIRSLANEQVNDVTLRGELRRSHGFCNQHAYQWLREARSVLGTALIYRDVLQASLRELEGGRRGRGERERACPVCHAQIEAEARYVEALVASVAADEALLSQATDGVCRRHAVAAIRIGGTGAASVVQHALARTEALVGDLEEVIRKEDYRFRDEPRTEDERTAPARAIAWAAGAEGLVDR